MPSVLRLVSRWGSPGLSTVWGSALTAAPPQAALANGALAHGLDFDDTHADSVCHASAVLVPTVLALAESERLTGRAVLTALVAGYEGMIRLGMAAPGRFHERGWHATAVCGAFGPKSERDPKPCLATSASASASDRRDSQAMPEAEQESRASCPISGS